MRVLFVLGTMKTGGIQTALCNLLNELVQNTKLEIQLFLFDDAGFCINRIPSNIKVIYGNRFLKMIFRPQNEVKVYSKFDSCFRYIMGAISKFFSCEYAYKIIMKLSKEEFDVDVAISYLQPGAKNSLYGGCAEFVLNKVSADKKIIFIHCDVEQANQTTEYFFNVVNQFDKIAVVSDSCRRLMCKYFPEISHKSATVYNCCDYKRIYKNRAIREEKIEKEVNIITVSRITSSKGLERLARAIGKYDGIKKIIWHIVGDGNQHEKNMLKSAIKDSGIKDQVIYYGELEEPYSLISQCDLLVISSLHEAAPMVIKEANALFVPVLSTETCSAYEMILHDKEGYVCENNTESLAIALKHVVDNNLFDRYRKELQKKKNDNALALEQFTKLVYE